MILLRFLFSFVCSVGGLGGFVAFVILKNYPAAILAVVTGLINLVASHVNFLNYKKKLEEWYSPQHLRQISWFGFYSFALSASILIYFTVVVILEKKSILPIHYDSTIISIIWASTAAISGLLLFWFARSPISSNVSQRLLVEEPPNGERGNQTEVIEP